MAISFLTRLNVILKSPLSVAISHLAESPLTKITTAAEKVACAGFISRRVATNWYHLFARRSIFDHVSRRPMVRLNTSFSDDESGSTQK